MRWPAAARVDHALESGQVVSTSYDPMLGKVIVSGPDREAARRGLVAALDDTAILGLTTNTGFLRTLVASDEFRDAAIDTAWLDTAELPAPSPDLPRVFVAWVSAMLVALEDAGHPFAADGWRSGADPAPTIVELDRPVVVDRARGTVDGTLVRQVSAEHHVLVLSVDERLHRAVVNVQPHVAEVSYRGSASSSSARTPSPTTARSRATARSWRRCPAPCWTSGSRPAGRSPRARCSAAWRR